MADGNYGPRNPRGGRGGRHHRPGGPNRAGGRHKQRRPLLTSAINAAGLSLVALLAINPEDLIEVSLYNLLAMCVTVFSISSFVSYFAQRMKQNWVEKISDVFFLIGALLFIWIGLISSGFLGVVGL